MIEPTKRDLQDRIDDLEQDNEEETVKLTDLFDEDTDVSLHDLVDDDAGGDA